jgi:L-ornithine N5-oxygenase
MTARMDLLDVLGIGFGPANIALAAALDELAPQLKTRFIERKGGPGWQPNMMLPGSDIQNHPLRDLVTPRNPRSRYSFTNFLFENKRLYEHLNLPLHYPLRLEYAQYVTWVAECFGQSVDYNRKAEHVERVPADAGVPCHYRVITTDGAVYLTQCLVLAPGRTPHIPPLFANLHDSRIHHINNYLPALAAAVSAKPSGFRVAVIGGSQSAVEILLHASQHAHVESVTGYTRNFGFRQKDTSPFSDEVYFPAFVDTFHKATADNKRRLRNELVATNYSSADIDVLNQLYVRLYEQKLQGRSGLAIRTCQEIIECSSSRAGVRLSARNFLEGEVQQDTYDLVVLATGFRDLGDGERQEPCPPLLQGLTDTTAGLAIARDYSVAMAGGLPTYLNGLCESSHGMGDAGSFSLLAIRSQTIVESLLARLGQKAGLTQYA